MEFMQLEMFVAVVEERTVRGASTRVLRSQPAVSMAISRLENEIGTPLFLRANRRRVLSEAGGILYRYARKLIDLRKEAMSAIAEVQPRLNPEKEGEV